MLLKRLEKRKLEAKVIYIIFFIVILIQNSFSQKLPLDSLTYFNDTIAKHIAIRDYRWGLRREAGERMLRVVISYEEKSNAKRQQFYVNDAKAFFERVRKYFPKKSFNTPYGKLTIDFEKAILSKNIIYNTEEDYKKLFDYEDTTCVVDVFITHNPLSLLSESFSYEKMIYVMSQACGVPSSSLQAKTVSLAKPKKHICITKLLDEKSLLMSLKNNVWVTEYDEMQSKDKHINYLKKMLAVESIEAFTDLLKQRKENIEVSSFFTQFAFDRYDESSNLVYVKLIAVEDIGFGHSKYVILNASAKPTARLVKVLNKKTSNTYFFINYFKNTLQKH